MSPREPSDPSGPEADTVRVSEIDTVPVSQVFSVADSDFDTMVVPNLTPGSDRAPDPNQARSWRDPKRWTQCLARISGRSTRAAVAAGRAIGTARVRKAMGTARVRYGSGAAAASDTGSASTESAPGSAAAAAAANEATTALETLETLVAPQCPESAAARPVRDNRPLLVLLAMILILACVSAATFYLLPADQGPNRSAPGPTRAEPAAGAVVETTPTATPKASPTASLSASPTTVPSSARPSSRSPQASRTSPSPTRAAGDVTTAKVGDCYVDRGTQQSPNMQPAACASGTLQVIARVNGTTNLRVCERVSGTTNSFYYESTSAGRSTSFVLCLKRL